MFRIRDFFKSKNAPHKFLFPTSFNFTGIRGLTPAATIFENSKKYSCIFASYRSFLELSFCQFFEDYTKELYKMHGLLRFIEIFHLLIDLFCKHIEKIVFFLDAEKTRTKFELIVDSYNQ